MENIEVKQSVFRCIDCGGPKSTEVSVRCWDCALIEKKSRWHSASVERARKILDARARGMNMAEIARDFGVSRQRVYQIVDASGLPLTNKDRRGGKRD
jgi:hypothetical protein